MRYLSLFSGAGGGDIAAQHMHGWQCAGYVEWDDYAQRVLAARIADGHLDAAPIYGDIREFVASGAAESFRGRGDITNNHPDNLQTLCIYCHKYLHDMVDRVGWIGPVKLPRVRAKPEAL